MTPDPNLNENGEQELNQQPAPQADMDTQVAAEIPEEKVLSEIDPEKEEMLTETVTETPEPTPSEEQPTEVQADMDTQVADAVPEEKVLSEIDPEKSDDGEGHTDDPRSIEEIVAEMESLANKPDAGAQYRKFNQLKESANRKITDEHDDRKQNHIDEGHAEDSFSWTHALQEKISVFTNIIREKHDEFLKNQEADHAKNLAERQDIIERLKNLYTNTEPGTNLFKAIREVKDMWSNAGQIAKSEFKLLNNNYFYHLQQFYAMLDLNKEYLEQEYSHSLEKRQHIISRAKELENEPVVQKALNELQYLHKLWKEEAEPVAEEFREKTWEEFKEISNKIHARKAELSAEIEAEQNANLEKKNDIISQIKALAAPVEAATHNHWQNAIKKVEALREEFLKTGSVPRKLSNQNWTDFKQTLREFNTSKNDYYKNLKGSQSENLERKQQLIQTAKDNMESEDWETAVPLFKKLQDEWKTIGHVPRAHANRVWEEFREACNTFFDNYRKKNNASNDNWKENYKNKKALLDVLKEITDEEGSVEKIEKIKAEWNAIGKVPKDKLSINTEFNKTLREKLKLNKINEFDLKDENLSESQLTDKARRIKNQIADLESEIATLENNLGFFSNSSRENPLLKDTYTRIDEKKTQLEQLKKSLHSVISGE